MHTIEQVSVVIDSKGLCTVYRNGRLVAERVSIDRAAKISWSIEDRASLLGKKYVYSESVVA